ncbi:MAG: phage head-tail connector protein [Anaerovoracaceae bacterium]
MAKLTNSDVLPIVKLLLQVDTEEKDLLLSIMIDEMIQRVEHYINQPPPIQLKYAVSRLVVSAYNVNYEDNAGNKVSEITEDKRKIKFENSSDSVNRAINEMSIDVKKDLLHYRKMAF